MRRRPVALYWNEHPSHFYPAKASGPLGRLKALKNALMRGLAYQGARSARCVMPIGEHHETDLLLRCRRDRVHLIHMGVDRSFSPPRNGMAGKKVQHQKKTLDLIYTGSVRKDRGRDIMLDALAMANRNGLKIRLKIVGASAEELEYCAEKADKSGTSGALILVGRVAGSRIPQMLHEADAGICIWDDKPYWRFNPPSKLFEYLVAGLPTLASNIRPHTLYIDHWKNGIVFNYDARSLASAMGQLWMRQDELPAMRAHALETGGKYLWDRLELLFLKSLDELSGNRT